MNHENVEFLQDSLKFLGFSEKLLLSTPEIKLKANRKESPFKLVLNIPGSLITAIFFIFSD